MRQVNFASIINNKIIQFLGLVAAGVIIVLFLKSLPRHPADPEYSKLNHRIEDPNGYYLQIIQGKLYDSNPMEGDLWFRELIVGEPNDTIHKVYQEYGTRTATEFLTDPNHGDSYTKKGRQPNAPFIRCFYDSGAFTVQHKDCYGKLALEESLPWAQAKGEELLNKYIPVLLKDIAETQSIVWESDADSNTTIKDANDSGLAESRGTEIKQQ
jgi:hypothetical protein